MIGKSKIKPKKSQITVFVIIALIIAAGVVLIFAIYRPIPGAVIPEENPQGYIAKCASDSLASAEKALLDGNGYINKTDNYILYNVNMPKEKVPYLCKAAQFYNPCTAQEPLFIEHLRAEFEKQAATDVERCFSELKSRAEQKGYAIEEGELSVDIQFDKKSVAANINKKFVMKKEGAKREFESFSGEILSPIYQLGDTARIIINFESTICEFDSVGYMMAFPDVSIHKFSASDQTKIYTLTEKISGKKLSFAVKTCVLPAGV